MIELGEALAFLPALSLAGSAARLAAHGGAVAGAGFEGPVRLVDEEGLIGIAEPVGEGVVRPVVVLRETN